MKLKVPKNNKINTTANVYFETDKIKTVQGSDGREYLVAPMVAIKEGVLDGTPKNNAMFYSKDVLEESLSHWNGKPLVMGHPMDGTEPVLANQIEFIDSNGVGNVFNARMLADKLILDARIDVEAAREKGYGEFIDKIKSGETVEVSTGHRVGVNRNDKNKDYVWDVLWIDPDHMAILMEQVGACSIEDGCGIPRANQSGCSCLSCTKEGVNSMSDSEKQVAQKEGGGTEETQNAEEKEMSPEQKKKAAAEEAKKKAAAAEKEKANADEPDKKPAANMSNEEVMAELRELRTAVNAKNATIEKLEGVVNASHQRACTFIANTLGMSVEAVGEINGRAFDELMKTARKMRADVNYVGNASPEQQKEQDETLKKWMGNSAHQGLMPAFQSREQLKEGEKTNG